MIRYYWSPLSISSFYICLETNKNNGNCACIWQGNWLRTSCKRAFLKLLFCQKSIRYNFYKGNFQQSYNPLFLFFIENFWKIFCRVFVRQHFWLSGIYIYCFKCQNLLFFNLFFFYDNISMLHINSISCHFPIIN